MENSPISWDRDERLKHWLTSKEYQFSIEGESASCLDKLFVNDIRTLFSQSLKRLVNDPAQTDIIKRKDKLISQLREKNYDLHVDLSSQYFYTRKLKKEMESFTFEYLLEVAQ